MSDLIPYKVDLLVIENEKYEKKKNLFSTFRKKYVFRVWAFLEVKEIVFVVNAELSPNPNQPIFPSL